MHSAFKSTDPCATEKHIIIIIITTHFVHFPHIHVIVRNGITIIFMNKRAAFRVLVQIKYSPVKLYTSSAPVKICIYVFPVLSVLLRLGLCIVFNSQILTKCNTCILTLFHSPLGKITLSLHSPGLERFVQNSTSFPWLFKLHVHPVFYILNKT